MRFRVSLYNYCVTNQKHCDKLSTLLSHVTNANIHKDLNVTTKKKDMNKFS